VFAAHDWRDLVLQSGAPIEAKARVSSVHASAFADADRVLLEQCDGRYCDLQSIQSEDTVTWSVFGVFGVAEWAPDLLSLAFGRSSRPTTWRAEFWRRLPHPDTGMVGHGPEADILLEAEGGWFYAVEAKWLSDVGSAQGRSRKITQLEMRAASVAKWGAHPAQRGVIVVALGASDYPPAQDRNSVFSRYFQADGNGYRALPEAFSLGAVAVTWEQIAVLLSRRPEAADVVRYLRWRIRAR
jgi:hypothetical protein